MNFLTVEMPGEQLQQLSVTRSSHKTSCGQQQAIIRGNSNIWGAAPCNDRKGMCYKCKTVKTHRKKSKSIHGGVAVMVPLTIEGEVFEGYCLRCHSAKDIPNYPNEGIRDTVRTSHNTSLGTSSFMGTMTGCSSLVNGDGTSKRLSAGKNSTATLENILIPPLSTKTLDRPSSFQRTVSVDTQPTHTSIDTASATSVAPPPRGKPPLQPRGRLLFKDLDILDYSSAEDENSGIFDCASSVSSNSHRRLYLSQSDDSIEMALPRSPDSILNDMRDHPADAMVQEFGCSALGQLNLDQMQGQSAEFIEVLLTAILLHGCNNLRIVEESVRTLRRLTFKASKSENSACATVDRRHLDKENCTRMESRGGLRLALNILKDYPRHPQIQRDALRIIRNVISSHNDVRSESKYTGIIDSDSLPTIIRAMLSHTESKPLQEDGCALLWMLAFDNPSCQMNIVKKDGVKAIRKALETHREVEPIYHHGCGVLHVLSRNEDLKPILLEEGILNFAFRCIDEHGYSPLVSQKACSILAELMVRKRGDTKLCVMHKQEVSSIVRLMNIHPTCRRVQKSALRTLEIAARAKSNLYILKECKPLRAAVRSAASAFPEECSRSACRLLSALDNR